MTVQYAVVNRGGYAVARFGTVEQAAEHAEKRNAEGWTPGPFRVATASELALIDIVRLCGRAQNASPPYSARQLETTINNIYARAVSAGLGYEGAA